MTISRTTRWALRLGFALALGLTLFFGARLVLIAYVWSDPAYQDQAMEGWMPLGYVGHSWDIPREVLLQAAGIDPDGVPRRSLEMIAREQRVPLSDLIARIQTGIAAYREQPND